MVIDMLRICKIKVKGNLISEINKCHLVRQKFFLLCFIFFFIFFLLMQKFFLLCFIFFFIFFLLTYCKCTTDISKKL